LQSGVRTLTSRLSIFVAFFILAPLGLALSGCSSDVAQLEVAFSGPASYTPGSSTAVFTVTVTNLGPGNASGVVIHAVMPSSFQLSTTNSIDTNGAARTTPEDASIGGSNPEWGVWSLSSPTSPNGKIVDASVAIEFGVNVTAAPSTYSLEAEAIDDNLTSTVESHPLQVEVNEAPRLGVTASVGPTSVHPNGQVTYKITVTNTGTEISPDVDVLVTLPPGMQFQSTIMPFGGNASIELPIFPVKGALLTFYGGFELPPKTSLGPGEVIIEFIAQCIPAPGKGVFPIQVQVTDSFNDTVRVTNVAPLNVFSS
jgi:uncharacterized repeat protein (TIGR01451 family)